MKKIILEATKEELMSSVENLSSGEKQKFKDLLKECAKEHNYERQFETYVEANKFLLIAMIGGLFLQMPEMTILSMIPSIGIGIIERKKLIEIYKCARNKRKMIKTMKESKKVIRLTESELVKLVQKIIKEDEMGGDSTEMSNEPSQKNFTKSSLKQLLSTQKQMSGYYGGKATNDYEYYKAYYPKVYAKVIGGRAFEPSPGGFTELRPKFNLEKTFLMKDKGKLDITLEGEDKDGEFTSNIDTYTIECSGGKVTISGGNVGP